MLQSTPSKAWMPKSVAVCACTLVICCVADHGLTHAASCDDSGERVTLTDFNGLVLDGESDVIKLHTKKDGGYDAAAWSQQAVRLQAGSAAGVSFDVGASGHFMCGLCFEKNVGNVGYDDIDFAAHRYGDQLYIFERGVNRGNFGNLRSYDVVQILVNTDGKVDYVVNGQIRYTSAVPLTGKVFVKISAAYHGLVLKDLKWYNVPDAARSDHALRPDPLPSCHNSDATVPSKKIPSRWWQKEECAFHPSSKCDELSALIFENTKLELQNAKLELEIEHEKMKQQLRTLKGEGA